MIRSKPGGVNVFCGMTALLVNIKTISACSFDREFKIICSNKSYIYLLIYIKCDYSKCKYFKIKQLRHKSNG